MRNMRAKTHSITPTECITYTYTDEKIDIMILILVPYLLDCMVLPGNREPNIFVAPTDPARNLASAPGAAL